MVDPASGTVIVTLRLNDFALDELVPKRRGSIIVRPIEEEITPSIQ